MCETDSSWGMRSPQNEVGSSTRSTAVITDPPGISLEHVCEIPPIVGRDTAWQLYRSPHQRTLESSVNTHQHIPSYFHSPRGVGQCQRLMNP